MEEKFRKLAAVAGVLVGAAVAHGVITRLERKPAPRQPSAFDKLVEKQLVCEELDGTLLADWFRKQQGDPNEKLVFFLAKPTENTAKLFALGRIPEELDRDHSLLQAAVTEDGQQVRAVRLISFATLAESVAKLLEDKEYVIINGGEKYDG